MNSQNIYKAIIFDMDGVIINSKDHVEVFWLKKLKEYGIYIPEEEREKRFHGRPARPTVNDLFAELSEETREEIIEECAEYDASVESYPMIPGVDDFIKKCVDAGIRIGLVTSALPGKVDRMLAGLSLSNPFECMVTANLVTNGKPDPECYLLAAEKLGIDPESMVVFEDSVSGVKSASDAGATVIGVNEDSLIGPLKSSGAVMVQNDFTKTVLDSDGEGMLTLTIKGDNSVSFKITVG
jgi:HAD superfamily hydrolase (TIGR01509 family)